MSRVELQVMFKYKCLKKRNEKQINSQEDERQRQENRVSHNKNRLKLLKNSINQIRTEVLQNHQVFDEKKWDYDQLETTQNCCDLLIEIDVEIDQLLSNASVFQIQVHD